MVTDGLNHESCPSASRESHELLPDDCYYPPLSNKINEGGSSLLL